ncbi:MAG: helix-turn-helix transcriptional regulator [Oscillospiraceae bacterium]|nr:helix-turn-helix transcriptional regulator [Oscillospiraceae bacterium]
MQITIGQKIRELRRRDGRTQETLADALGVTSQAVSRWEAGGSYPDMEIIPSIANYFGITIDELFGYECERTKKIDALVNEIQTMNKENNGVDVCIDRCLQLAREAMVEFPGNERIMLCLASVLYNTGYVRYGEHHLTDTEGYDVYDVERHKTYTEWQEAIKLYEKLLSSLGEGDLRHQAVRELVQLYVNTGCYEKAMTIADNAPSFNDCRELLRFNSCDGSKRSEILGDTLLKLVETCSSLMISGVMVNKSNMNENTAVQILQNAAAIYDLVYTDKNYGLYNGSLTRLYLYMSEHLWLDGNHDDAFAALDKALECAKAYEGFSGQTEMTLSAPLLRKVKINPKGYSDLHIASGLSEDWPWWCVPDCSKVKAEMQADPRWAEWVAKTRE